MSSEPQSDADPLSAIRARLDAVHAAARDNEVDVFNPAHHAQWADVERLLALYDAALARIAALEAAQGQLMAAACSCPCHREDAILSCEECCDGGSREP